VTAKTLQWAQDILIQNEHWSMWPSLYFICYGSACNTGDTVHAHIHSFHLQSSKF